MFRATTADHLEECSLLIDFNEKEKNQSSSKNVESGSTSDAKQ